MTEKIIEQNGKYYSVTEVQVEIKYTDLLKELAELIEAKQNAITSFDERIAKVQAKIDLFPQ